MALGKKLFQITVMEKRELDKMTEIENESKVRQELKKRLIKLQDESAVVHSITVKTNQLEYENIAAIYVWWHAAQSIDGFLAQAYQPTKERQVYGESSGKLSFRRLLFLMYGLYALDKDNLDRKNRALVCLHLEFEKNYSLYEKDSVSKLAAYIKSQGGINKLIDTSDNSDKNKDEASAASPRSSASSNSRRQDDDQLISDETPFATYKPKIVAKITDIMRLTALGDEAVAFFIKNSANQSVTINPPIPTDKDGYAIAVIKRTASGYEVVSATGSMQSVKDVMISNYRTRYDAVPNSMRCILELLKTQSLPANLLKLYDKLTELSNQKRDDNTKRKVMRRVAYIASQQTLILSPTYSSSGVVTLAKLRNQLFEGEVVDCFMPTRCRKQLEQRLIAPNDFHMFKPTNNSLIHVFNYQGTASHMLRLENKVNSVDFLFTEFWPFETSMGDASKQLLFSSAYAERCPVQLDIPQSEFKKLAYDHVNKWLASYGDHFQRPANKILKFGIGANGFLLGFDWVNNTFRNEVSCDFDQPLAKSINYQATFLSKDLFLALHSIGDLQLIGDVHVSASENVVVFQYSTAAADYTVAVPTSNINKRNDDAFSIFVPMIQTSAVIDQVKDAHDIESDLLFEQALSKSRGPMTDAEIDKIIGIEPDNYDEIIEGYGLTVDEFDDDTEWVTVDESE